MTDNIIGTTIVISRELGNSFDWNHDQIIDEFMSQKYAGLERAGSGAGLGLRDLEYDLEGKVTADDFQPFFEELTNLVGQELTVSTYYLVPDEEHTAENDEIAWQIQIEMPSKVK